MSSLDSQLIDELARCYVHAAVTELLAGLPDCSAPIDNGDVRNDCDVGFREHTSPVDHESARRVKR